MIKTEILKTLREKSIYLIMIFLVGLMLMPLVFKRDDMGMSNLYIYEENLRMKKDNLAIMKNDPTADYVIPYREQSIQYLEDLIEAVKGNNREAELEALLKYEQYNLQETIDGRIGGTPQVELEKIVLALEYLFENQYAKVDEDKRFVPAVNYFIEMFYNQSIATIILVFVAIISSYLFSIDKRRRNLDLLNSLPKPIWKIALIKYLTTTGFVMLCIGIPLLITLMTNIYFSGLGNLKYPVGIISEGYIAKVITAESFFLRNLVFIFMWVILISVLSFCISLFTKSTISNLLVLLTIILTSQYHFLFEQIPQKIAHFIPSFYVDFPKVITGGSEYFPLYSSQLTVSNGMVVLSAFTCILIMISGIGIYKKESI